MAQVVLVVLQGVTVTLLVAIPRREVDPEADAGVPGGGGEFADDVPLAAPPSAGTHGIIGVLRGPQAEAVVVLGRDDHAREAAFFGDSYPLSGAEVCGVEDGGVHVAGTPLRVVEGVDAEVEEECHVAELPLELERVWEGQDGKWWGREVRW